MPISDDRSDPVVSPRLGAGRLPARRDTPPLLDETAEPVSVAHRLPEHHGKLARITEHVAGLSEDLREWVELRVEVMKREIEETAQAAVVMGVVGALAGFFALLTLALGFSALYLLTGMSRPLGYFLGFLTLTVLLGVVAFAFRKKMERVLGSAARYRAARKARAAARDH